MKKNIKMNFIKVIQNQIHKFKLKKNRKKKKLLQ